jgi:hypothetical protein
MNEQIATAWKAYTAYDDEQWEKICFDDRTGGYNVYHREHKFAKEGGGGDAEKTVGRMLARLGKQVEFLPEKNRKSPDLRFDGQTWDVKYLRTNKEETVRKTIRDGRKADNIIFYWDGESKLTPLHDAIIREAGRFMHAGRLHTLPRIYYMDADGNLKLFWKKP